MCELILTWIEFVIPTNPPKSGNDITGKVESLAGDFCCDSVNFETARAVDMQTFTPRRSIPLAAIVSRVVLFGVCLNNFLSS